jgi:hypothetical protein
MPRRTIALEGLAVVIVLAVGLPLFLLGHQAFAGFFAFGVLLFSLVVRLLDTKVS